MAQHFKYNTGSTITNTTQKGNISIATSGTYDWGPTSSTGFYPETSAPSNGYTIYYMRPTEGPSVHVATSDDQAITFLKSFGATGSTINETLSWASGQSNYYVQTGDTTATLVTSGLTLNLDAGNASSYPGTGTTWTDLSGNGNNATLSGSPTYSSLNGGKLTFPYANVFGTINDSASIRFGTGDFTINIWEYTGVVYDATNQRTLISKNYTGFEVMIYQATLRAYFGGAGNSLTGTATLSPNTWYHFVIVRSGTTITSYINKTQDAQITSSANISQVGTALLINKRPSTPYYGDQTISTLQLYNRALTSGEITQNYNATKSRFGL
jgi:hypothetical protein